MQDLYLILTSHFDKHCKKDLTELQGKHLSIIGLNSIYSLKMSKYIIIMKQSLKDYTTRLRILYSN